MSFIEAFFSFNVEISNVSNDFHGKTRVKAGRHVEEPPLHFYARILALIHSYVDGVELNTAFNHPDEPSIYIRDALSSYKLWSEVGDLDPKKIMCGIRNHKDAIFRHYFYNREQLARFCGQLRGTKSNWIAPIQFFMLPADVLETLHDEERSQVRWSATLVDHSVYLSTGTTDLSFSVDEIDIWREYQASIGNA